MKGQNFRPSLGRRMSQRSQIIFYRLKQKKLIRKLFAIKFFQIANSVNFKLKRSFLSKVRNRKKLSEAEMSILMRFDGLELFLYILYYYFMISAIIAVVEELFRKPSLI